MRARGHGDLRIKGLAVLSYLCDSIHINLHEGNRLTVRCARDYMDRRSYCGVWRGRADSHTGIDCTERTRRGARGSQIEIELRIQAVIHGFTASAGVEPSALRCDGVGSRSDWQVERSI